MKHFINNTDGQLYAFADDGSEDSYITVDMRPASAAEVEAVQRTTPTASQIVLAQISALEASVTQRRIREATLTEAGRLWLQNVDAQIAALRASL